jgi:hypothetical protein
MAKRKAQLKPCREVWLVEWFDAHDGPVAWTAPEEVTVDRVLVQSVGFLLPEASGAEDHLRLVTSDADGEHVSGGINIPKVNVTSMRKLA